MGVLVALSLLTGATVGLALLKSRYEEREARAGRPKPLEPGDIVDMDYLGDGVAVKVYGIHGMYEAHVYWNGNFIGKAGGFVNVELAKGWGRSYARNKGADV